MYSSLFQVIRHKVCNLALWLVIIIFICIFGCCNYFLNYKFDKLDELATAHQKTLDAEIAEALVKFDQTFTKMQQVGIQISELENKINDVQSIQNNLQLQYQDITCNRDIFVLDRIEEMLSSMNQQLQMTGNTQRAIVVLQKAYTQVAVLQNAQAIAIRNAIAQDLEKLKSIPFSDMPSLATEIDAAIEKIDFLPLIGDTIIQHIGKQNSDRNISIDTTINTTNMNEPVWKRQLHNFLGDTYQYFKSLVQIHRINNADTIDISQDQRYLIRENIKLRLLSLRFSMVTLNESMIKTDLRSVQALLSRYFDQRTNDARLIEDLLKKIDGVAQWIVMLNFDTSLNIVKKFKGIHHTNDI
ncbi:MAG: uroporphyrinogen-III C-methyltransferase [Burkholderia sp.]|nr:uroporphyrinogen-III C-methyltransferase [Burkholderia sp.]